jgi:hypothetical protein
MCYFAGNIPAWRISTYGLPEFFSSRGVLNLKHKPNQTAMSIIDFVALLLPRLKATFTDAVVDFDGENLSVYYKLSDASGDFVQILVDMTCMAEQDAGTVAVHARPDHIFVSHLDQGTTLMLEGQEPFVMASQVDGSEFPDGHANNMWMFEFPENGDRIADLASRLVQIAADYFEGGFPIRIHSSSSNRNSRSVCSDMPFATSCVCVISIRIISSIDSFIDRTSARSPPRCVNGFAGHVIIWRACLRLAPAC